MKLRNKALFFLRKKIRFFESEALKKSGNTEKKSGNTDFSLK